MNKHQAKGSANEVAGKIEKDIGKATANGTQQVKGAAREIAGKTQKAYGDAKSDMQRHKRDRDMERREH